VTVSRPSILNLHDENEPETPTKVGGASAPSMGAV
jgi:hypothetical protein